MPDTPAFIDPDVIAFGEKINALLAPLAQDSEQQQKGLQFLIALHCLASILAAHATEKLEDVRELDELCRNSARGAWLSAVGQRFPDSAEALAVSVGQIGQAMKDAGLNPVWPGDKK